MRVELTVVNTSVLQEIRAVRTLCSPPARVASVLFIVRCFENITAICAPHTILCGR